MSIDLCNLAIVVIGEKNDDGFTFFILKDRNHNNQVCLFPDPLLHFGGEEVEKNSKSLASNFESRVLFF